MLQNYPQHSPTKTGGSGTPMGNGTPIVGPNGRATLGMTGVIRVNGKRQKVWLTVAHAASKQIAMTASAVSIKRHSTNAKIGKISQAHYFRDKEVDAALIIPDVSPVGNVEFHTVPPITSATLQKTVEMRGGVSGTKSGKVVSIDVAGQVSSDDGSVVEQVEDHFYVERLASDGDSGAVLFLGGEPIGMVRAVTSDGRITVACGLDNVLIKAKDLRLRL